MRTIATLLIATLLIVSHLTGSASAEPASAEAVDFAKDVTPILQKYCVGCHTADDPDGGFAMDSHASLLKGGESGAAITAGEPSSSRLVLMTTGKLEPAMPPEGEPAPSEGELALIAKWIDEGASGKDGEMPVRRELRTPAIATDKNVTPPVTALAISANGTRRAQANFSSVAIEDANGRDVCTIEDQPGKINAVSFSKDGSRVLIASGVAGAYGLAAVYDSTTAKPITEIVGHRDTLYAAVFSPDETQIATAGYDRNIFLWDASTGEKIREFKGHNGAVFDLAFSPSGKNLVSACADETVKVWNVATGQRLATLGQPEGEVYAVDVTDDGQYVIAGSADNRLRVWRLASIDKPATNPIVATRFIDESPIVGFQLAPNGKSLVVLSEAGNVKVIRTSDWNQDRVLKPLPDSGSDIVIDPASKVAVISMMNGEVVTRALPKVSQKNKSTQQADKQIFMDLGEPTALVETELRKSLADANVPSDGLLSVTRNVQVTGTIDAPGQTDRYQWRSAQGEVWAIDADRIKGSKIDPIVTILDAASSPVLRVRLQAVRDSYFTFRGKDSKQVTDFRIFNWRQMNLKQYLYSSGEVVQLWMHPRGPDSGFNVYPGEGNRWTYFGTTHTTHALGEPAYIVQPLDAGAEPLANGLPVFDVFYENDDDPMRKAGVNSRLLFTAPADGLYTARVGDTRGDGGADFKYQLGIRAAHPSFTPSVAKVKGAIRRGTGREFTVRVDRIDGFDGPVTFDIPDLPPQVHANTPLTIEPGQRYATGNLWVAEDAEAWDGKLEPKVVAWANINGRKVERSVGTVGELTLQGIPSVIPSIQPIDRDTAVDEEWTLVVPRGGTAKARLTIKRKKDFTKEVSFGKEFSGRNTSAGVYVDNIGLNGLIVLKESNERVFFVTADISATPGKRSFFLRASVDGNVTSFPITVEVK